MGKQKDRMLIFAESLTIIERRLNEQIEIAADARKLAMENNRKLSLLINEVTGGNDLSFKKMQSIVTKVSDSLEKLDKAAQNQAFGLQTALQIASSIEKNAESVLKAMKGIV